VLRRLLRGRGRQGHVRPQDVGHEQARRDLGVQRRGPAVEGESLGFFPSDDEGGGGFFFSLSRARARSLLLCCCHRRLSPTKELSNGERVLTK